MLRVIDGGRAGGSNAAEKRTPDRKTPICAPSGVGYHIKMPSGREVVLGSYAEALALARLEHSGLHHIQDSLNYLIALFDQGRRPEDRHLAALRQKMFGLLNREEWSVAALEMKSALWNDSKGSFENIVRKKRFAPFLYELARRISPMIFCTNTAVAKKFLLRIVFEDYLGEKRIYYCDYDPLLVENLHAAAREQALWGVLGDRVDIQHEAAWSAGSTTLHQEVAIAYSETMAALRCPELHPVTDADPQYLQKNDEYEFALFWDGSRGICVQPDETAPTVWLREFGDRFALFDDLGRVVDDSLSEKWIEWAHLAASELYDSEAYGAYAEDEQ